MAVRVLVVDDSRFFRRRVTEILESDPRIKVIDIAENGSEAVKKASRLKPDVITMDVEMPVMDGISATRKIMADSPTAILMFSSLTTEGATATLDALDAGAVDYVPKKFEDISTDLEEARRMLIDRVLTVGRKRSLHTRSLPYRQAPAAQTQRTAVQARDQSKTPEQESRRIGPQVITNETSIIVIGTSTGGPVALQNVLSKLPNNYPLPLLLIQHMPGSFTTAFADRLNSSCQIRVKEAEDYDRLAPGLALLAPGGKQMILEGRSGNYRVRIRESQPEQNYKPSVDTTFYSVAKEIPGKALAIVLTGMGSDGREGAKSIKAGGSKIWAQDEQSSVVYGMPAAIVGAGLADKVLSLEDIGSALQIRK